jgi:hypothetical protein
VECVAVVLVEVQGEGPDRGNHYAPNDMAVGSAVRNRSETITVVTPRGEVEVVRQEMRGLRRGSSWTWFWLAHRTSRGGWSEASTAREAIRRAMLLPPRKVPAWLNAAAAEAERKLTALGPENGMAKETSGRSEAPAVDEPQ